MAIKINPLPSQEYLNECFLYDPDTGVLAWRERPAHHFERSKTHRMWNTAHAGKRASCLGKDGYYVVKVQRRPMKVHRVVWTMINGSIPDEMQIDHINMIRTDNRWSNLRLLTPALNKQNRSVQRNNALGIKGVWQTSHGGYSASLSEHGRQIYLGYFKTAEEAAEAYRKAAIEARGESARLE